MHIFVLSIQTLKTLFFLCCSTELTIRPQNKPAATVNGKLNPQGHTMLGAESSKVLWFERIFLARGEEPE